MSKIFIDAGHGGKDPGAVNGNVYEKDIALQIAIKLSHVLAKSNCIATLSRFNDIFVPLIDRANKANQYNADIFVSIHLNSSANKTASGIETLVYKNQGVNNKLATIIQNELINSTNATNRGIKERPDLVVLNSTKMPAVLVEVGFVSNEKEKDLLIKSEYQDKIAQAIAKGILNYLGLKLVQTKNDKEVESMTEIKDVKAAIKKLQDKGVISSPDYWINAVNVVKYLDTLIINMANKIS